MKNFLLSLFAFILINSASSQEVLDQSQLLGGSGGSFYNASFVGQSFTAGLGGNLSKVSVEVNAINPAFATRYVYIIADSINGPKIDSTLYTFPSGFTLVDIPLPNQPSIISGHTYFILIEEPATDYTMGYMHNLTDPYPGGQYLRTSGQWPNFIMGNPTGATASDMVFKTFVIVSCMDDTKTFDPAESIVCHGDSTTIDLPLSEEGIVYTLNALNGGQQIGPVLVGNGGTLKFPTGVLTQDSAYTITGNKTASFALDFGHADTATAITPPFQLAPHNLDITWNFWVKIKDTLQDQCIVSYASPTTTSTGYEINYFASQKAIGFFYLAGGILDTVFVPVNANEWNQVSFTFTRNDGGRAYKNGTLVDFEPSINIISGQLWVLQFGADQRNFGNISKFSGELDEFSMWNVVMSDSAIAAWGSDTNIISGGEPELECYYKFNSPGDSIENDISANGYNILLSPANYDSSYSVSPIFAPAPCQLMMMDTAYVISNAPMSFQVDTFTNVDCYGDATGTIDVTASGGSGTLDYNWNNGVGTIEDPINLLAGDYIGTVTDSVGCQLIDSVTITQNDSLYATYSIDPVTCYGLSDGSINSTAIGGTGPYAIFWFGIGMVEDPAGLVASSYYVNIQDTLNCQFFDTVVVSQPDSIVGTASQVDVNCVGGDDGSLTFTGATGGNSTGAFDYDLTWSDLSTGDSISNLIAGNYYLLVADSLGCEDSLAFTITELFTPPTATISFVNPTLTAMPAGDTYEWLDCDNAMDTIFGETSQSFSPGIGGSGNFAVIITENGCSDTSNCFPAVIVATTEDINGTINVSPNPSSGVFNLTSEADTDLSWVVRNISGTIIRFGTGDSVDLSDEPIGLYFLQVNSGASIKLIRE